MSAGGRHLMPCMVLLLGACIGRAQRLLRGLLLMFRVRIHLRLNLLVCRMILSALRDSHVRAKRKHTQ